MPKRKVIVLLGSKRDSNFAVPIGRLLADYGVDYEFRIASAHRTPSHLMEILKRNEESGDSIVYITIAGLSDALSGVVAAFTKYPVIACPPDSEKHGWSKVFSSTMTPRGVAVLFVAKPENAALAAAKILAVSESSLRKNIVRYRQRKREEVIEADKEIKEGS